MTRPRRSDVGASFEPEKRSKSPSTSSNELEGCKQIGASNLRRRILTPAVELATERLVELGGAPLPTGLTPHSLRRTFASCYTRSVPRRPS